MRRDRIMVTVSPEMRAALYLLAKRSGITEATQATVTLRQALDRTIGSDECRKLLARQEAFATVKEWRESRAADAEVARLMATEGEELASPQTSTPTPPIAATYETGRRERAVHTMAPTPTPPSLAPEDDAPPRSAPSATGGN